MPTAHFQHSIRYLNVTNMLIFSIISFLLIYQTNSVVTLSRIDPAGAVDMGFVDVSYNNFTIQSPIHVPDDGTITWCVSKINCKYDYDEVVGVTAAAFDVWSMTGLVFKPTSRCDRAHIRISFKRRYHGDSDFDGEGGLLAHAFLPNQGALSGDIHMDNDETFAFSFNDADYEGDNAPTSYFWTVLHEIGHTLGLQHSSSKQAIMYGFYVKRSFNNGAVTLSTDDMNGINELYHSNEQSTHQSTRHRPHRRPSPDGSCRDERVLRIRRCRRRDRRRRRPKESGELVLCRSVRCHRVHSRRADHLRRQLHMETRSKRTALRRLSIANDDCVGFTTRFRGYIGVRMDGVHRSRHRQRSASVRRNSLPAQCNFRTKRHLSRSLTTTLCTR
ncbi:44.5 kDa Metalloprotease/Matrixin [Spodoptera frugiperda ascovirus 1a]|uniref:Putative matrix metalloproteinase n=1 Tax=Spodoptera frugiperda ascovirus 1a TaxID=113370 RepID=MMP_SFAVA|nr:44.5 kDa Metalloprotease/Matrixin [Spodoptera frugiperda ascovirus 1a]Q0E587.1 RecName: Full=Putative matrix metalloproteinase; Flags: Precursor [Spodoptera frugiperda ascovirus 1a]CAL44614.1 44.5 kDa Metalloprotease/Matrixin [Spodoptera frugiperda ascovirus 1a]